MIVKLCPGNDFCATYWYFPVPKARRNGISFNKNNNRFEGAYCWHVVRPCHRYRFLFTFNLPEPGSGTLGIIQHRAKNPFILNISLELHAGKAILTVDKLQFELAIAGLYIKSLCIELSPGDVLHLIKRD